MVFGYRRCDVCGKDGAMRRARSPCRNRGTVWITRVSTNQAAAFRPEWSFLHLFHMFGIDGFSRQNGGSFAVWHSAEDLFPIFLFPHHAFSVRKCSSRCRFCHPRPTKCSLIIFIICSHSALPKSCLFGNPIQRGRRHSSRSRAEGMVTQRKGSSSPARPRPGAIGKTSPDSSPIGASPTRLSPA